jgi:hypothetical protein
MSSPSKRICPVIRAESIRSFIRLKHRRRVDLPHPEGPISAVTVFFGMRIEISRRACFVPYQRLRSLVSRVVGSSIVYITVARLYLRRMSIAMRYIESTITRSTSAVPNFWSSAPATLVVRMNRW